MQRKIITILIIGTVTLIATAAFSAEDYNSSRSNTQTSIVNQQVGDILLRYGAGGAEINKVTDVLAVGIDKADLKTTLIEIGIGEEGVNEIFTKLDELGAGFIKPDDQDKAISTSDEEETPQTATGQIKSLYPSSSEVSAPTVPTDTVIQPPTAVSGSVPTVVSTVKKCGVNTFTVLNECGVGAFKNMYFQCYDDYEEKQGGESSCKSSDIWSSYARSVCANRCGVTQAPTTLVAPVPLPIEVKPIALCYIPDKLTKDYNRLLLDLRKAESEDDTTGTEVIIKKITALKLEIEKYRKECLANAPQVRSIQPTAVAPRLLAPITIDRCQEVSQWENKIVYYEKLNSLSDADLKEQTGFSKEEIERILLDLPQGLEKVRVQCEDQRDIVDKMSLGTFSTEILSMDLKSIAQPVKPVVVESGQEIDDYYKARIEKITATEDTEEQIQNLRLLKEEIDGLILKFIKGRKEMEASEISNVVREINISRGEIRADDVIVQTIGKKILVSLGGRPISVEPTARRVLIRDKDWKVEAEEISIKDNVFRVGEAEVKLTASDVIETIEKRPGRTKYANITLERGIVLKEENGRAVYKIKETEPRKLFGFIPIRIIKTLTVSAETSDLLDERLPWYAFLTTR